MAEDNENASVTTSQQNLVAEETKESLSDTIFQDPVISFFSRQPPKNSFPEYPPNADSYDEDLAEEAFLRSKPTCFMILGKPGAGKTTLAASLAREWKCQLVNGLHVISEAIRKRNARGRLVSSILASGEALSDELVMNLIDEKIKSAEVAHQGYVLDDFPALSEEFMTIDQQLEMVKSWVMKPDFIISIKIPDNDLENRRVQQKVDPITGELFAKTVYDTEIPSPKPKPARNEEDAEEEVPVVDETEEEEVAPVTGSKLPAEVISRLIVRPEDHPANVRESIRTYNAVALDRIENFMAYHDQQYLIELDGNKSADGILQDLLGILRSFPINPAVLPIRLADPVEPADLIDGDAPAEPKVEDDMDTESLMRTLSSKLAPLKLYRWRRSRWLKNCPVALADGEIVPGKAEFAVGFLDKIYFLSSASAMELFIKNPRPFLLPLQPRPPCKIFVHGPPRAGKTQLCYRLADKYDAQVINVEKAIRPKIVAERDRRRKLFMEACILETTVEVRTRSLAESASEQRIIAVAAERASEAQETEELEEELEEQEVEDGMEKHDRTGSVRTHSVSDKRSASMLGVDDDSTEGAELMKTASVYSLDIPSTFPVGITADHPLSDHDSPAEFPSRCSLDAAAEPMGANEPASVPVFIDGTSPEVLSIVELKMRSIDFYDFELPAEVWLETLHEAIAQVEQSRLDRDPSAPLHGGWIVEDFPKTVEQWTLFLDQGKHLPDTVIYLQDESPNGDFLTQRCYSLRKVDIDERIRRRKAQEEHVEEALPELQDALHSVASDLVLPEEPELNELREARKLYDTKWANVVNILAEFPSLELIVVDVSTKPAEEETGSFTERSRNKIFDEVIDTITKPFRYQAWERTEIDIEEEEAVPEEEESEDAAAEEEKPPEENEEEVDPNRSPAKQLGDTNFYCPVALVEKGVLWPGNPEFSAKYREKIYYLANDEAREKFIARPTAYLPTLRPFTPPATRLFVLGPRGSGKSLYGRELAEKFGLFHIQFRDYLQEIVLHKTMKRVRPEREEEQELEEQELPPDEEEAPDEDDSDTETTSDPGEEESKKISANVIEESVAYLPVKPKEKDEDVNNEAETLAEASPLTEDMLAIIAYLKDDEALPVDLFEKLVGPWWHEEPYKSAGFILEGLPHSEDEAALLVELGLFPDAAVILELQDSDVIARLLPARLTRWRNRKNQKLERRRKRKETRQNKRKAKIAKRRNQLEKRKAERLASIEETDEKDEEAQPDEVEEDIEAILAEEFPEEEEEEEEENETEQDAIERMKSEISETYETETSLLSSVTEKLKELIIRCIPVKSDRKPHIVRYQLSKKLHSIFQCRYSMFERVYAVKPTVAEKLLSYGYKQLSRFGQWCPVKLMGGDSWMLPDYKSGAPYLPALYRQHVYFMSSVEAREQFVMNPLVYLCQPSPKAVVPIRLAVIGPPKSGKSTVARRFAEEFGVMRLSIGEALRWVLGNQPNTALSKYIQSFLINGQTVPDECTVQALEVVLMSKTCRTQGFVLDGYPSKRVHIDYMEQRNIIPVVVIELQMNGVDCADRATVDRYSKDRVVALHDSAQAFYVKWSAWQSQCSSIRHWYRNEHDNWIGIPGDKSKWWVWSAASEAVKKSVVQIQTYLQRTNAGEAASIAGMCITPREFERRLSDFKEYCPVNLVDNNQLVDCSQYKHLTYAAEYKGIYYKMESSEQLAKFLSEPKKYVLPGAARRLPPPGLLPRRRTSAEAKLMFPMQIELRGYCTVTFLDGKCRYEAIVPGDPELVAEYDSRLYYFASEKKLQKFMRSPHLYVNLKLPHKLPPKREPLVVKSLPMLGYMEQTVATALTKALTAVGSLKPKLPFMSATKSALLYAACYLKAFNPQNPEHIRQKYKKKLDQFEEICELVRYLSNNMSKHYTEPKDRPSDFDSKLDQFVRLQHHKNEPWVSQPVPLG